MSKEPTQLNANLSFDVDSLNQSRDPEAVIKEAFNGLAETTIKVFNESHRK